MTDQKQAPERDSVKWWIEDRAPVDVAEAFETLTKQRDELAAHRDKLERDRDYFFDRAKKAEAERDELAESLASTVESRNRWMDAVQRAKTERDELSAAVSDLESVLKDRDWPSAGIRLLSRALRAKSKTEAERDLLKNWQDHHATEIPRLKAQLDQALAASAAREIAMRDRAVEAMLPYRSFRHLADVIRALPLSPDGQLALDDERAKAWAEGHRNYLSGENPYRKA